jgi:hypothetical protein
MLVQDQNKNQEGVMATTSPGVAQAAAGEFHLQRRVGLQGLTMISLGSIIGSGWLLGAITAPNRLVAHR